MVVPLTSPPAPTCRPVLRPARPHVDDVWIEALLRATLGEADAPADADADTVRPVGAEPATGLRDRGRWRRRLRTATTPAPDVARRAWSR